MTNNGPMWVPHGLQLQYRTHICLIVALCPDAPIWDLTMLAGLICLDIKIVFKLYAEQPTAVN